MQRAGGGEHPGAHIDDVAPPALKSLLAFSHELMPLVDGGDTGDRSGLVVEDLVSDMRSNAEIATILGISEGAAEQLLVRARRRLREMIGKMEDME